MSYKIQETYINRTEGYIFENTAIVETNTETLGELFKQCQKEFGRCEGKMFIDTTVPNEPRQVGWVFARMSRYEDARLKDKSAWYCREVWITVFGDAGDQEFSN